MMILTLILKILSNKWTYILLFLLSIFITISILIMQIENAKSKINTLYFEIDNLKITNTILLKENIFRDEQIRLINTFTNSTKEIQKISNKELTTNEKNAITSIHNDFYNYMQNYKSYSNSSY